MQPENLKPLTALRFFAAAWVVLFAFWPRLDVGFTPQVVSKGYLGVEVFFILSGFILSHVYLPAAEARRFRYGAFLWARLARIYPLHLVCLAAIGSLATLAVAAGRSIDPNILNLPSLAPNLLLLHAWGLAPVSGWNHPSWSISAEWFAYLAFPAFAWAAIKLRKRPEAAVAAALVLVFAMNALFLKFAGFPLTQATISWGALRIVPCFAYGCALYLVWRSGAVQSRTVAVVSASLFGALLLVGAQAGAPDPVLVALAGGLILFLASLSSTGSKALSNPVLVYLGEISYSIYMVHTLWDLVFTNGVAAALHLPVKQLPLGLWLILLVGVVPLAAASYHLIERPARERLRTWRMPLPKRGLKITSA
jgi:peptidoglycan/LPS O-acetylase OafA/YrhL